MIGDFDLPAWIFLMFGLYSLGAGTGELRSPGFWLSMIDDFEAYPSLRFLTGIICLALGGVLYLIGPWAQGDWMVLAVKAIGTWMIVEGFLFLSFSDVFIGFAKRFTGSATRLWAVLSVILGLAMIAAAALRF